MAHKYIQLNVTYISILTDEWSKSKENDVTSQSLTAFHLFKDIQRLKSTKCRKRGYHKFIICRREY